MFYIESGFDFPSMTLMINQYLKDGMTQDGGIIALTPLAVNVCRDACRTRLSLHAETIRSRRA